MRRSSSAFSSGSGTAPIWACGMPRVMPGRCPARRGSTAAVASCLASVPVLFTCVLSFLSGGGGEWSPELGGLGRLGCLRRLGGFDLEADLDLVADQHTA